MGSRRAILRSTVAILLGSVALSACDGSSDPKPVVKSYLNALASGDGTTACKLLDPKAINKLLGSAPHGQSCSTLLSQVNKLLPASEKQALQSAQVTGSSTSGNTAKVTVSISGKTRTVNLIQSAGNWVITSGAAA
ncbi:MAG TPA: hypothetical protein VGY32_13475 [Solirubrobacteraceae bacterium]|nr:hypothetical protein [Solirubrobacteraceae bacterium]